MKREIVAIGEGMIEVVRSPGGCKLGFGGDVLNSAIHLARFGRPVAFFTALGADRFSHELTEAWEADGLDTGLILTDPERQPGLYAIHTDPHGERTFQYWREQSAARRMFELPGSEIAAREIVARAGVLLFSLITLAILPPEGRRRLLRLAGEVKAAGGRVAYDGNFRAGLWSSIEEARAMHVAAIEIADIGVPTDTDERALFGDADAATIHRRWTDAGVSECVVKMGAAGCLLEPGVVIRPPRVVAPVDTSGAGDAFNAGYLAARLDGQSRPDASLSGHHLAEWVIGRQGALPSLAADAPYGVPARG